MKESEIRYIKGVGPYKENSLKRIGISSIEDLIYFFPRWNVCQSLITPIARAKDSEKSFIKGVITNIEEIKRRGINILKIEVNDGTSTLTWVWFNRPYLKHIFKLGMKVLIYDILTKTRWGLQIIGVKDSYELITDDENNQIEKGEILGFYKSTKVLTNEFFRDVIRHLLNTHLNSIEEIFPFGLLSTYDLYRIREAILKIHFPNSLEELEKSRRRLVFNELFMLQLFLAKRKIYLGRKIKNRKYIMESSNINNLIKKLSFTLTNAQERVIEEIKKDLFNECPMNRLLQGDVGSGKTIVALISLLIVLESGYQVAIMAPTEILADQHFNTFTKLFNLISYNKNMVLLTSKLTSKERKAVLEKIKNKEIDLVIGTHALIQEDVEFNNLGFIIIDERHKFGVFQRLSLESKGMFPDCLMMTATPFPRALVLTLYGDTDLSVLDEMPPGRKPIYTRWVSEKRRDDMYEFIKNKLKIGEQVYIVYPLVEESSKLDLKSAEKEAEYLQENVFHQFKVGLIHGRLTSDEKNKIMDDFKNRKFDILVSTTVIEVGIDVSNATIILIEHAERFGLAQLHQLRGRVGRGSSKSFCFLITSFNLTSEGCRRLKIMEKTTDGFKIAEEDLQIRGPGELFGLKQHGELDLKLIDLKKDLEILEIARKEGFKIIKEDPEFLKEENEKIKKYFDKRFKKDDLELVTVS
ncbi:MAG: ATP-dependent DNA helicase RecG [Candidatus Firestonebacteria bacterium]